MSQRPRTTGGDVRRRPETKSFILTSEFWVAAGAVVAVFVGGYALDDIADTTTWRYGTWIAIAYIVSRGIAKAGSQRTYQPDPYDDHTNTDFWGNPSDERRQPEVAAAPSASPRTSAPEVEPAERETRPPSGPA